MELFDYLLAKKASGGGSSGTDLFADYPTYTITLTSPTNFISTRTPATLSNTDKQSMHDLYVWLQNQTTNYAYVHVSLPNLKQYVTIMDGLGITNSYDFTTIIPCGQSLGRIIVFSNTWITSNVYDSYGQVLFKTFSLTYDDTNQYDQKYCACNVYFLSGLNTGYVEKVHTYAVLPETSVVPNKNTQFVNKKYVDDKPTTYTGYDATKTQVLKNINGTLTWVDEV